MPTFFRLMSEYFWLIALAFGAFNYRKARSTIVASVQSNRARLAEFYLKRFALGINLPWVVMGLGKLLGYTPTVLYYFRPQDGNPFVIAWLAVVFFTGCLYAWWVLFRGGAQKVFDLNLLAVAGKHSSRPLSLFSIKLLAAIGPLAVTLWIFLATSQNIPLPK